MGRQEEYSKKQTRRTNLRKIILQSVSLTGVLAVGLIAPNVLGAMSKLGLMPVKRQGELIRRSRDKLIDNGMLRYDAGNLRITPKGEVQLRKTDFGSQLTKPKRWDGKWRVLIFDIPEARRSIRFKVRITLKKIGFLRLQDSVWIYPYDCEDYVNLIKADFKIGKDLLYMIVDSLEYDAPVRKHFGLAGK